MEESFFYYAVIYVGISVIFYIVVNYIVDHSLNHNKITRQNNWVDDSVTDSEEFLSTSISKVKKYAQQKISKSYLTSCTWMLISEDSGDSVLYTFRSSGELLITINGLVQRGSYELIIDNNSILITKNGITEHYNIVNAHSNFLFMQKISSDNILTFANYTKAKDQIKSNILDMARRLQ